VSTKESHYLGNVKNAPKSGAKLEKRLEDVSMRV